MKVYDDFGTGLHVEHGAVPPSEPPAELLFHMHPHYELLVCTQKNVSNLTVINGKKIAIDYPMALLCAPFSMHYTYFLSAAEPTVMRTALYFDEPFLDSFGVRKPAVESMLGGACSAVFDLRGMEDRMDTLLSAMFPYEGMKLYHITKGNTAQELLMGAILHTTDELADAKERILVNEKNYVADVVEYIVRNLDTDLTISELSGRFFISRDKLCRDFRRYTQMNIGDFIGTVRFHLAKQYLEEGNMTVKEVAARCGFENDIYFYTFFKKHEGCTPRDYVRSLKEKHL